MSKKLKILSKLIDKSKQHELGENEKFQKQKLLLRRNNEWVGFWRGVFYQDSFNLISIYYYKMIFIWWSSISKTDKTILKISVTILIKTEPSEISIIQLEMITNQLLWEHRWNPFQWVRLRLIDMCLKEKGNLILSIKRKQS